MNHPLDGTTCPGSYNRRDQGHFLENISLLCRLKTERTPAAVRLPVEQGDDRGSFARFGATDIVKGGSAVVGPFPAVLRLLRTGVTRGADHSFDGGEDLSRPVGTGDLKQEGSHTVTGRVGLDGDADAAEAAAVTGTVGVDGCGRLQVIDGRHRLVLADLPEYLLHIGGYVGGNARHGHPDKGDD